MRKKHHLLPAAGSEKPVPQPTQRLSARALLEVKQLSDPQIHPDGQRIAFVVQEADFDDSRMVSHLWLTEWLPPDQNEDMDEEGDLREASSAVREAEQPEDSHSAEPEDLTRQLTFSQEGESDPLWSPDGNYLAFLSLRPDPSESSESQDEEDDPAYQIWILPEDGGEARKITSAREGILDYAWTPDSDAIVYLTQEPRPRPLESLHKERERHKFDPIVEQEDRRRRQVWRVDVEEGKPKLLFTGDYGIESFALSPQGDRIAYLTNYTGEDNDYHIADLYVRHLDTGATVKLIRREGGKYRLRWSPDGAQIAFLSWFDSQLSYSRESVYAAQVPVFTDMIAEETKDSSPVTSESENQKSKQEGGSLKSEIENRKSKIDSPGVSECCLLSDLDYDITAFEWRMQRTGEQENEEDALLPLPNGVYALAAVRTGSDLYHLNADSASAITEEKAERRDLHVHQELDICVFVQESAQLLPEIYLRDAEGQIHRLTRLNTHLTETYCLPRQRVVTWNSADGMSIEGVLTYPLNYQEGERYPLMVQVHGGPKGRAADTLRDYTMSAVWASEGYLVLRPNFRGSEGYGNAFAIANRRDLGGGDFADIMAGVDWCITEGLADADRLGIMGGSYGGFMTNWAIGHTDRFQGAVSMFGIFHLQTDYSNSMLSRWEHDYIGAYYWEEPEIYRRLSPGSYLDAIKTPTLIIHGDDDDNTNLTNSREMYRALRQRGIVTQFVHYPREGHGLREPNHRLDEMRRSLAWMDRFVKHGGQPPQIYRVGDKVPAADGLFELCITRVEIGLFAGQPEPENSPDSSALLEVALTLHRREPDKNAPPVSLALADLHLQTEEGEIRQPVGVPLEVHGAKALLEGENLRLTQRPDKETGELAFALATVFRVPKQGGEGLLCIGDFPPVVVAWTPEMEEEAEKHQHEAAGQ